MYRIGYPFWKLAARAGVPMLLRVEVIRDHDAGVFVATSSDLRGLVAEAKTADDLVRSVYDCIDMLLEAELHHAPKARPLAAWSGEAFA